MENRELAALVDLLDEPDLLVYQKIYERIFSYGRQAIPYLQNNSEHAFNPLVQKRLEGILGKLKMQFVCEELKQWAGQKKPDLTKGWGLISQYQYPDFKPSQYLPEIEKIKRDIWLEINDQLTALEKIRVMNHMLFGIHRFTHQQNRTNAPANTFLNNLMENHRGNRVALGMLYLAIAQGLGLPVYGVNLPQHFILAYCDAKQLQSMHKQEQKRVLFYINPAKEGSVFTVKEIELFIKQMGVPPMGDYFKPCSNITIIIRLLDWLIESYQRQGKAEKAADFEQIKSVLN